MCLFPSWYVNIAMVPPSSIWKRRSSAFFVTVGMMVQHTEASIMKRRRAHSVDIQPGFTFCVWLAAVLRSAALCGALVACSGESSAENLDDTLLRAETASAKVLAAPTPAPAPVVV